MKPGCLRNQIKHKSHQSKFCIENYDLNMVMIKPRKIQTVVHGQDISFRQPALSNS